MTNKAQIKSEVDVVIPNNTHHLEIQRDPFNTTSETTAAMQEKYPEEILGPIIKKIIFKGRKITIEDIQKAIKELKQVGTISDLEGKPVSTGDSIAQFFEQLIIAKQNGKSLEEQTTIVDKITKNHYLHQLAFIYANGENNNVRIIEESRITGGIIDFPDGYDETKIKKLWTCNSIEELILFIQENFEPTNETTIEEIIEIILWAKDNPGYYHSIPDIYNLPKLVKKLHDQEK